ncbi:MAG: hypothetical protein ISS25_00935 [Nanoarchaeota archaeon]|nr:hypothetical protein [DPANN group archaeon]MBL7116379.1 hypothetical protein [Nanoarchaeota archaeon]
MNLTNQELQIKRLSFSKSSSNLRIILNPEFKKEIFDELFKKHSSSKSSVILNISRGTLYHYKNNRVESVSFTIIEKIRRLLDLSKEEINKNSIEILKSEEVRDKGLVFGRKFRRIQLKKFREKIPKVKNIVEDNFLNLEKWFSFYKKLIDFGCREIKSIQRENNILKVKYTNYAKGKKKLFTILLPRKIKLDEDFQYFFGLWVGDKAGGGRIGVINKEKVLNLYTAEYLRKLYQRPEFVLYIHKKTKLRKLNYDIDKIIRINSSYQGYAISVHATNGVLKSFFEYLEKDLDEFLNLIPNRNVFFAGLFDAEGNVFLEDHCFRWSCKDQINIKIFSSYLKETGLFHRFDGSNIVTYNKEVFSKSILPFIRHPVKINDSQFICFKKGILNERFKEILRVINNNPGKKANEIAKALKKVKLFAQLRFLEDNNYIHRKSYPHKIYITNKGVASLSHGGKDL